MLRVGLKVCFVILGAAVKLDESSYGEEKHDILEAILLSMLPHASIHIYEPVHVGTQLLYFK